MYIVVNNILNLSTFIHPKCLQICSHEKSITNSYSTSLLPGLRTVSFIGGGNDRPVRSQVTGKLNI